MTTPPPVALERRRVLHRRAVVLEWFTVGWNVVEALVAVGAGLLSGSVALIGFGVDSGIEVISAVGLLWRLRTSADAPKDEETAAERRALYVVGWTFFALAAYVGFEAVSSLLRREAPEISQVGIALSAVSLVVMPALALSKQRIGHEWGSRALLADAAETWVCSYLSLALLLGLGLNALFGWWWADAVGGLAMLPVVVWQGFEALREARESQEEEARSAMNEKLRSAFLEELTGARRAEQEDDIVRAWRHLERAHVLSQAHAWPHLRVHGRMFAFAWRRRDGRELLGQLPRLLLAAPGSWTGRAPRGNTGGAGVGIFTPMEIPADLAALLSERGASSGRRGRTNSAR